MAVKAGDLEQDLIESLGQTVDRQLAEESPDSYREFVRQYYHWVPAKDLADRDQADLCGAVVAHWRTARHRDAGRGQGQGLQPRARARRLDLALHRPRDRLRRHAVHRRLGDDGAEPPGLQHRAHDPPGDARRARRRRGARRRCSSPAPWPSASSPSRSSTPRWPTSQTRSACRCSARGSSSCSRRCEPPSRTGRRCGPRRPRWPRSCAARRRPPIRTSSPRPRRSCPGWPTSTSPSWATASTC